MVKASNEVVLYSRKEYFETLAERIRLLKNGDDIALASMSFHPEDREVATLMSELCGAAQRGANVRLMVDAHAFMADNGILLGPLFFGKAISGRMFGAFRRRFESLEKLRVAGGAYVVLNKPGRRFSPPVAGRSHIKFCVLNDQVFIGGCNLALPSIDLMVGWQDKGTSRRLLDITTGFFRTQNARVALGDTDQRQTINKDTILFIDAGVKKQSLIRNEAVKLIDSAEKYVYMTCQFFPNDGLLDRLEAAIDRGVKVTFIYNNPLKHDIPYSFVHWSVTLIERLRRYRRLFENELPSNVPFLHAKLLATDKGTIVGSHNYVSQGVNFGTAEMSIFSSDPDFGKQAKQRLSRQLDSVNSK